MTKVKSALENTVNRWDQVKAPVKVKKSTQGNIDFSKYTDKMRTTDGLSVSESAELLFGKNYTGLKSQHYTARNTVARPAWRTNDKSTELSVAIGNSGDQRYYIIPKSEYSAFVEKMMSAGHTVKIDSDNQYTPEEIGQE